jgi:molybdopterin-guanine dinucleotide biosynthesis protein A
MTGSEKPAGVILAGGRSSRMGVTRKALLELDGRSLLAHVIDRLQAQLDPLILSCESQTSDFDTFSFPVVADLVPRFRGPLTGLSSALQYLADKGHDNGMVLCPCDAPFVPETLAQTLLEAGQGSKKPVVVVSYQGVLQPTFSLWHNHHLPVIQKAVMNEGMGGLKQILASLPHTIVDWELEEPPPFFNVNTPEELQTAATWLDHMHA